MYEIKIDETKERTKKKKPTLAKNFNTTLSKIVE